MARGRGAVRGVVQHEAAAVRPAGRCGSGGQAVAAKKVAGGCGWWGGVWGGSGRQEWRNAGRNARRIHVVGRKNSSVLRRMSNARRCARGRHAVFRNRRNALLFVPACSVVWGRQKLRYASGTQVCQLVLFIQGGGVGGEGSTNQGNQEGASPPPAASCYQTMSFSATQWYHGVLMARCSMNSESSGEMVEWGNNCSRTASATTLAVGKSQPEPKRLTRRAYARGGIASPAAWGHREKRRD